jgi:hypothetical protein
MMRNKICAFVIAVTLAVCSVFMTSSARAESAPSAHVVIGYPHDECSFRFSPVDFCDQKHLEKYRAALDARSVNFDNHYVLLSMQEWGGGEKSLVAIDKITGAVYPVPIDSFFSFADGKEKGKKARLEFSKWNNEVCIYGSILVYRATETGRFCFRLEGERFVGYHTTYMGNDQP